MRSIAALLLLLTSCGRNDQAEFNQARFQSEGEDLNRHLAEVNALIGPQMPRGWHYTIRPDRIRNRVDRLASLANEDADPQRDQTLILTIQQDGDEPPMIFFRSPNTLLGCATTCGIEFRSGETVGTWSAERIPRGDAVMLLHPAEALRVIRSARTLIVEVDSDIGGQHTFNAAGLTWPPTASSR